MKTLQNSAEARALSCVWILTGNARQPLACRWIDEELPFPTSAQHAVKENEPRLEGGRMCA